MVYDIVVPCCTHIDGDFGSFCLVGSFPARHSEVVEVDSIGGDFGGLISTIAKGLQVPNQPVKACGNLQKLGIYGRLRKNIILVTILHVIYKLPVLCNRDRFQL